MSGIFFVFTYVLIIKFFKSSKYKYSSISSNSELEFLEIFSDYIIIERNYKSFCN